MKQLIRMILLAIFVLLLPTSLMAANKAGYAKIVEIKGEASVKRRGGDREFKAVRGMKLVEGDSLYTKAQSSVSVVLDNNSQLVVGENSVVDLAHMSKLSESKSSTDITVKKGSVFSNIKKKLTDSENYTIKTPNAVAGVRGTKFYVQADGKNSFVYVLEGKVKFSNRSGEKSIMVKKGQLGVSESAKKPFILKGTEKEERIRQIKDDFHGGFETQIFSFGSSAKSERLSETVQGNSYSADQSFDPLDAVAQEPAPKVPTKKIRVDYPRMPSEFSLTLNGQTIIDQQSAADIDYSDNLHIKAEIRPAYIGIEHFSNPILQIQRVEDIGVFHTFNLNVVSPELAYVNISLSDLDLSGTNRIIIVLDL